MNYDVNISKEAKEDLREIYNYIALELISPKTALNQLDRIKKAILSLDNMPTRCRIYDEEISPIIRFLPITNYIIFYIVKEESRVVEIARVLYGGRNFSNIL